MFGLLKMVTAPLVVTLMWFSGLPAAEELCRIDKSQFQIFRHFDVKRHHSGYET